MLFELLIDGSFGIRVCPTFSASAALVPKASGTLLYFFSFGRATTAGSLACSWM